MAATRTSTRQAAQKAKEAISGGPGTKSKGGAGAKRKEAAHKGPEPKRSKKEDQKPVREAESQVEAEERVEEKKEEPIEQQREEENGKLDDTQAGRQKEEPNEEQAAGAEEKQTEGDVEEKKEEPEREENEPRGPDAEQEKTADEQEKPTAHGDELGVPKSPEREATVPSNILEKGLIYFFYRARVNVAEPHSVADVARSFIVLRPTPLGAALDQAQGSLEAGAKCRLMLLPKKKFPTSGRERDMGFVEKAGQTMKELQENFIAGEEYQTSTGSERSVPEAKPYAEGVYAITSTKRASHLAYILTIPTDVGPLQEDFGLHARGSWIMQSKNPQYPGPSYAQLPKDPEYPESVREQFQDHRWAPLTPEFIDYANAQFLMIGGATNDLDKEPPGEELEKLEEEDKERLESLNEDDAVYQDLRLDAMTALPWIAASGLVEALQLTSTKSNVVNQTTCGGTTYAYTGLEGYGFIPSNATDKYGDTLGGIGSSIAIEPGSWHRTGQDSYAGTVYVLPDRGWNTNGTLNFQPRIHKIAIELTLAPNASPQNPSNPNLHLTYLDTILLTGPDGQPTTGLDADETGHASYPGYPPLPAATYTGDGFGGAGPGGKRIALDPEGLGLAEDGFWVSDEYGPYVYKFTGAGQMVLAIQPPEAILPHRNGTLSFSAASPPLYDAARKTNPADPQSGRNNNQGLEALTLSADGRTLYTMLQSALNQEGGPQKTSRQPARLLEYDVAGTPVFRHEYVVLLPRYDDYRKNQSVVASQSEMHLLPTGDFLVLSRDSGFGHGQAESRSVYRHADVLSISNATTDLKGRYDAVGASLASPTGKLKEGITPVQYCAFLDFNVESELAKFGLHNGGPQDAGLLNEKWEGLALVPVNPDQGPHAPATKEYFLFSFSDNDFMTQDGHLNFGHFNYADESGYNIDNQVLVFRVEF
ncbi:esterase-like activity of phytase-domain-containing protein [Aspergillus coremiiformis]|uniref:Esterase-like activity of phytase-domain-containing protein n=1 Tax=Aspergillus coremiiformis TaxID=138285 RepID=A0A5N6Z1A8_9EURO|nr:esterase-like activity of phytase-domain-containing protein [Aspergillus coremiiformis]